MARVAVIGAGVMGRAIAATFAGGGLPTVLVSRDPDRLGPLPAGVAARATLPDAPPELVIEAIPEDLHLKRNLFLDVERRYATDGPGDRGPILASNTSGLPLQEIAAPLARPDRFLGIHYFFPADELPLVEVIRVAQTTDATVATARGLLAQSGRDSVVVPQPVPGGLVNRLQHAILHEAYHLMSRGLATPEDIDKAARWLLGPRMCVSGLLEQKDLGGLTGHILAQRTIVPDLCHDAAPNADVQAMLERGETGIATGRGFYDWTTRDGAAAGRQAAERLRALLDFLEAKP
ncbi:3-hydroxyacyl-CoA dehydrogenase NAD-binding domain-containing protein [uncultured Paracoccus sp.]|uniref:3-hydroxyacyl-CoA dehydrogenase family protein n=1 Tax=uncultured Paracoccus sp. TaxID=189685 RepID=UPI002601C58B|nr:3-hydroxyacyl-CoA dehydrogenase NAD-binding domain-containing protein [uncultured Paracoccus sp.]